MKSDTKLIRFAFAYYKQGSSVNKESTTSYILSDKSGLNNSKLFKSEYQDALRTFCEADIEKQRELLNSNSQNILGAFIEAVFVLESDKTLLTNILPYIDAILFDDQSLVNVVIDIAKEHPDRNLIKKLQAILVSQNTVYNSIIYDSAARILSCIYSNFEHVDEFSKESKNLVSTLINNFLKGSKEISDYLMTVALSNLLLVPEVTDYFLDRNGLLVIKNLFKNNQNDLQIMYYTLLMVWILSFEDKFIKFVEDPKTLIIFDILTCLKKLAREKLVRVGLKIFRNLSQSTQIVSLMIDNNLLGFLNMELRKNIKDEQLKDNINFLIDVMEKNYKIFSSYEKYLKEVDTAKLTFGPCHTAKFWKEHIKKTENNNFQVIEKLIQLLDSEDETTQAVACYDLGEFSRLHPFSKTILENFDGKTKLMKMIEIENPIVKENALVAIQKLMINNWQILA